MCLLTITSTDLKKTQGLGWKVFRVTEYGKIYPGSRGYANYEYDCWYSARERWDKAYLGTFPERLGTEGGIYYQYKNGFHIALRREDARAFIKYMKLTAFSGEGKYVIRQVEYRGAHTLGQGNPNYFGGPQVIADEIRILKPRPGGSAYARVKETENVPS